MSEHDDLTVEELTASEPLEKAPGYDAWFERQVRRALQKHEDGTARYRSLESVMRRFNLLP